MTSEPTVVPTIYIVVVASTVLAILWGIIFKDILEYHVGIWNANSKTQKTINYKTPHAIAAYLGMSFFVWVCVSSSLAVFVLVYWIAAVIGTIVVIPTALLIWFQLGSMLHLLATKGYEAVDIETLFENETTKISNQ